MGKNDRDGKLLTTEELAARWSVDPGTIENWRTEKKGPIFIKLGSGSGSPVRYRLHDVVAWEEKMARKTK